MSSLGNVNNIILEPSFDRANNRCEFRFNPDTVYLSDLRLINIGLNSDSATDSPHPLLGLLGAIKKIQLLDGSTVLDQLDNCNIYNAFQNANQSNDSNISMNRNLNFVRTGYVAQGNYTVTTSQFNADQILLQPQFYPNYTANLINNQKCWISLKEMLPFLKSSMILPTGIFRQLRVVIEYNSAADLELLTRVTNAVKSTKSESLLLCEEFQDQATKDALEKEYKGVVYQPVESEKVSVPAASGAVDTAAGNVQEQRNNYLLNGFNNKKLMKLLIQVEQTDKSQFVNANELVGFGNLGSLSQYHSTVNFRVNGTNILPGAGMRGSGSGLGLDSGSYGNRRLGFLNDTYGVFNVIPGQQVINYADRGNFYPNSILGTVGQQDYIGINIFQNISELQLTYNRNCVFGADKLNQALNLNIFGQVEKALVMNEDKSYNVIYVQ